MGTMLLPQRFMLQYHGLPLGEIGSPADANVLCYLNDCSITSLFFIAIFRFSQFLGVMESALTTTIQEKRS